MNPNCLQPQGPSTPSPAYVTLNGGGFSTSTTGSSCAEDAGAYPAVNFSYDGDVYVAFEHNWATNLFGCPDATSNFITEMYGSFMPTNSNGQTIPGPAGYPLFTTANVSNDVEITSMDSAFISGYNRFPASDFPRIAFSNLHNAPYGTASIVWNDAGNNPLGDILLQTYYGDTLNDVQSAPVKLNNDSGHGTLHFMPGLRNANVAGAHSAGMLNVTWYDRRNHPSTAVTDVYGALNVDPYTTSVPIHNILVTDHPSNWQNAVSDIIPNFGDYTDNYVNQTNNVLFVAWSDGRLNVPQPFSSHN